MKRFDLRMYFICLLMIIILFSPKQLQAKSIKEDVETEIEDTTMPFYSFKFYQDDDWLDHPTTGWAGLIYELNESLKKRLRRSGIIPNERDDPHLYGTFRRMDPEFRYNGQTKSLQQGNNDKAIKAIYGAAGETIEKTPIGEWFKDIERKMRPYFRLKMIKHKGEKTKVYLPGRLIKPSIKEKEKEWGILFTGLPYSEYDPFMLGITGILEVDYGDTKIKTTYDTAAKRLKLSLKSDEADKLLTKGLGLKHKL